MAALKLPEEISVRDAGSFLSAFIVYSREVNGGHFQPIVQHNIEHLVRTLLYSICKYFLIHFTIFFTVNLY